MKTVCNLKNEKGAALVIALGVMSVMIIIAVTVAALSMNSSKTVGHDSRLTEAQNLAEAGIDDVIAVTLANFYEVYPGGNLPDAQYPGDGMPFYDAPQEMTDGQGNVNGTYEVWTKEDPERPGNVLITAEGTMGDETSKVRTSVRYLPEIFGYSMLIGDFSQNYTGNCQPALEMKANPNVSFFRVNGPVHVNGCISADGEDDDSEEGNIRMDGPVTYTDSFTGTMDGPVPQLGDEVVFPIVDYDNLINKITINTAGSNFTMNADEFEQVYGAYDYVAFINTGGGQKTVTINGSGDDDNPWVITSTLVIPPQTSGSKPNISNLDLKGPGLSLQPGNGIAVLADEGKIEIWKGTVVGAPGAGALVYITGSQQHSQLQFDMGATLYGSMVSSVGTKVHALPPSSGNSFDKSIRIEYDAGFLANLPDGWMDVSIYNWIGIKENFEIDNSG